MFDTLAFGALIRRKRGEKGWSQQRLAESAFDDPGRKGDISRLENAKVANPQEATIRRLCDVLEISEQDMVPIRAGHSGAKQLDNIAALDRDGLELLASRFNADCPHEMSEHDLRRFLTDKAAEYRDYKAQIDALDDRVAAIANLKGAAQDAAERLDFDAVETLLSRVDEVETEIAAETKLARARNALMRGRAEQAFDILSAAADSFASVDPLEPVRRRFYYEDMLFAHGLRYGGDSLKLAARMNRDASNRTDRTAQPLLWARTQHNLAIATTEQGKRTSGAAGTGLLAQAVTACRAALEVATRDAHPADWAKTQNNLAIALQEQGKRVSGAAGAELLTQAVTAYREALEVRTRDAHPVGWAMTQNNLAVALQEQGIRTGGAAGADLLAQAVTAYRAALEVRTRDAHPVDWAMTQNNLANALQEQGNRISGAAGAELLAEAVSAYRAALKVYTSDALPVDWAMTQYNLAEAELAIADHDTTADPLPHLRAALGYVEAALEVFDPQHMPYNHEKATALRALLLDQ